MAEGTPGSIDGVACYDAEARERLNYFEFPMVDGAAAGAAGTWLEPAADAVHESFERRATPLLVHCAAGEPRSAVFVTRVTHALRSTMRDAIRDAIRDAVRGVCDTGKSRSAAVVVAYLVKYDGMSLRQATLNDDAPDGLDGLDDDAPDGPDGLDGFEKPDA